MHFAEQLKAQLSSRHLLNHPYYQMWNEGKLTIESLRFYASQYYHHVSAFPRYISATHANCSSLAIRQILLENLTDEELGSENHPELWLRFTEALGLKREQVKNCEISSFTHGLIQHFMDACKGSFEQGLGSLFAYEHQIPEIAKFKSEALQKYFDVHSERGLAFFKVHEQADVYHTEALAVILEGLSEESKLKVTKAAHAASEKLWSFLDGVQNSCAAA